VGQKAHPTGLRLGINKNWKSVWYANKRDYRKNLSEDMKIRKYLKSKLSQAGISSIDIEEWDKDEGKSEYQ